MTATMEELRDLARRNARAQRWGFLAALAALLMLPALALVWTLAPGWLVPASYAATLAGGAVLVLYARVAGQSRGAFRKVFRRISDDRKAARRSRSEAIPASGPR